MWERTTIRLACGCESGAVWDDVEAGDEDECKLHGMTTVRRKSRIMDAKGSRNYQLETEVKDAPTGHV